MGGKGIDFSLFGTNDNKQDAKIFAELSEIFKGKGDHTNVFDQKIKGLTEINREHAKLIKKTTRGNVNLSKSFLEVSQSAGKMTVASRAATVAMGALKTVGTVLANMAIVAAITAIAMIPFQIAQAANEARIAAIDGAKALVEDANAIDNYKVKISELQKALNSGTLTQGEAYNKRKELMSIQDELIGKYGTEKDVVDTVTEAVLGNVDALDTFNKKSYDAWYTKNNTKTGWAYLNPLYDSPIEEAKDFMEGRGTGYETAKHITDITDKNTLTDIVGQKSFADIAAKNAVSLTYDSVGSEDRLRVSLSDGTPEEYIKTLTEVRQKYVAEMRKDFPDTWEEEGKRTLSTLDYEITRFQDGINKHKDIYQTYLRGMIEYESEYSDEYATVLENRSALEEAQLSGNVDNVKKAQDALFNSLNDAFSASKDDKAVLTFFKKMYPELQTEFQKWDFNIKFSADKSEFAKDIKDALAGLSGLDDLGIDNIGKESFAGTEEQENSYIKLADAADEYSYKVQDLTKWLVELGLVQSDAPQTDLASKISEIPPIVDMQASSFKNLSESIDQVQSAYNTIGSVISDYNDKGYMTIDNLQAIMSLGDDYIGYLFNENGQMQLNKEGMLQLANARLDELEAKALSNAINSVSALTDEASATAFLTGKTKEATEATQKMNEAKLENLVSDQMARGGNIAVATQQIIDTFNQYKSVIDLTRGSLGQHTDATMGATNATKDLNKATEDARKKADDMLKAEGNAAIKSIDKRIKALQKQMSLLDEQYKKEDDLLKLQKAKDAWENAKNNRNTLLYTANTGWKNVADPKALKEAEDNLKEIEKEKAREDAKKLLQDEIDKLNELKEKYQESMSHIGETLEEHMLEMQLMAEFDGMSYEQMATNSDSYTARVIANLNAESQAIANRNKVLAENATSSFDIALPGGHTAQYESKEKADMAFENAMMHYGDGVKKKYATGGVNDFTGIAQLDGSPTAVETIFNASDGKKLFDLVHNSSSLTADLAGNVLRSMRLQIPRVNLPQIEGNNKPTMENYNFYGELSFPNVTNENDARKFINTFRQIVNQKR